jgi:phosphodiesterase/alkaline phosphatase D-like protein
MKLKRLKSRHRRNLFLWLLLSGFTAGHLPIYSQPFARYFWSGALSSESIRVNAKLSAPCSQVRLAVDTDSSFNNPIFSPSASVDMSTNLTVSFFVDKLSPNTTYYYAFEFNYVIDLTPGCIGSFRTPQNGPFSLTFAFNSCIGNAYHTFTQRVKNHDPLFFINMGDLHYGNPNSTDINVHRIK